MITAAQCRAARALLGWSQDQLATEAKVGKATIATFETGKRTPYGQTLAHLRKALEAAGVILLADGDVVYGGEGVRLQNTRAVDGSE